MANRLQREQLKELRDNSYVFLDQSDLDAIVKIIQKAMGVIVDEDPHELVYPPGTGA